MNAKIYSHRGALLVVLIALALSASACAGATPTSPPTPVPPSPSPIRRGYKGERLITGLFFRTIQNQFLLVLPRYDLAV